MDKNATDDALMRKSGDEKIDFFQQNTLNSPEKLNQRAVECPQHQFDANFCGNDAIL